MLVRIFNYGIIRRMRKDVYALAPMVFFFFFQGILFLTVIVSHLKLLVISKGKGRGGAQALLRSLSLGTNTFVLVQIHSVLCG